MNNQSIRKGDTVRIISGYEGYRGKIGTVFEIFPSGRIQVSVGKVALLNLSQEEVELEVSDRHSTGHAEKADADE